MVEARLLMYRPGIETAAHDVTRDRQLARLNRLLARILPQNAYYAKRLGTGALPLSWEAFHTLPFTTKADLVADQQTSPPLGTIATYPQARYVTFHQTSGTTGRPLAILDTEDDWNCGQSAGSTSTPPLE